MSGPFTLIIGSHNHIPYGSGDDEFERVYTKRLKPFVVALNNFPKIPAVLHYSGVIFQWIEKVHPEFLMLIEELISRKQVELLGGGFYEPLLPLLPLSDKIGQIEMLTTYLRQRFGKRPLGCWLPALAWEQNLVGVLTTCGMGYTFLGNEQFAAAGLSPDTFYVPHISEDQGKLITVFPLAGGLYGRMEREGPFRVLEDLAGQVPAGGFVSLFPERFSKSDDTSVSEELLIQRFFEDLSRAESFVDFAIPGRIFKIRRGLNRAYFPCSARAGSYPPAGEAGDEPFSAAISLPRQFLIRSAEANGIYSKMMFTHMLINHLRGDKSRKKTAREELWKAQGYDALSSTEGICRRPVRGAVYQALLTAEKITRGKGGVVPSVMTLDFDLDGEDEYLFQQERINSYIKTGGASVFELDYLPMAWNYLDTLASRRNPGDGYRRAAFADRLAPPELSFQDALAGRFSGARFCGEERFDLAEIDKAHGKARFRLASRPDLPFGFIELEKFYQLKKDTLVVAYNLANRGNEPQRFRFFSEIDMALPGEGAVFQRIFVRRQEGKEEVPAGEGEVPGAAALEIQDIKNQTLISFTADRQFTAWIIPIRTLGEDGVRHYQSTCVMPVNDLFLESGECWEAGYTLRISPVGSD